MEAAPRSRLGGSELATLQFALQAVADLVTEIGLAAG
jgi:hypothetical protein